MQRMLCAALSRPFLRCEGFLIQVAASFAPPSAVTFPPRGSSRTLASPSRRAPPLEVNYRDASK